MNILIMSAGKKVPLIKCVKAAAAKFSNEIRVICCDSDDLSISSHFADDFMHTKP